MKKLPSLNHRVFIVGVILFSLCSIPVLPAGATETATSKCITATTKSKHATYVSQMEKDIAPYIDNEKAKTLIATYREKLTTAWAAMEDQYCGFGAYGAASSIKSYTKSIERARADFLAGVKKLTKIKVEKKTETEKKTATTQTDKATRVKINKGLHLGTRSEFVTALQKLLTEYFNQPQDDSHVTGYFGKITRAMVIKFQLERGLIQSENSPGAGLVGPKTAAALNEL